MVKTVALSQSVVQLKGVGDKVAERLSKLDITAIQDLLFHLPLRYQDRTRLLPMGSLRAQQEGLVEGTIRLSQIKMGRRRSLLCHIDDGTGSIVLRFFHFSNSQLSQLAEGTRIRCFGEARSGPSSLEMVHPEYQIIPADKIVAVEAELTPIYPTTEVPLIKLADVYYRPLILAQNGAASSLVLGAYLFAGLITLHTLNDVE